MSQSQCFHGLRSAGGVSPKGRTVSGAVPGIMRCAATEYAPEDRLHEDGRAVPGPRHSEGVAATIAFLLTSGVLTGQVPPLSAGFVVA